MPAIEDVPPPEWLQKLMEIVGKSMAGEDPVHCQVWHHDDDPAWHIEVSPSLHEEAGELYLREYHVHLTPIIAALEEPDVIAEPESVSIIGKYENYPVHIIVCLQPEEDEEQEEIGIGSKKPVDTPLPN